MSESPARFQAAPAPSAEIRSLAIAKLKRAASLPRTPDGRRQPQTRAAGGPSAAASEDSHGATCSFEPGMTHSSIKGATQYGGDEELLAASSSPAIFGGGSAMKRSNSESSSLHIPTPYGSANASPFFTAQASPASNPGTDWAAYQLAQSYLPSISPAPPSNPTAPPSSFPANLTPGAAGAGRNTPSPLPSLGELRNLSRSNSAAARQNAMNKLIGGAATPTKTRNVGAMLSSSEEDVTLSLPGSVRQLHRSGTIGVPRMFGMPAETVVDDTTITPIPDTAYDVPRPRLQRSFTVSSSNMGEERRSAVGRRMVERLGARRAARQQEETEVRQLWEERRRTRGSQKGLDISTPDGTPPRPAAAPPTTASAKPPPTAFAAAVGAGGVAALLGNVGSDRTASRNTQHSDNVFEYEDHLKRSMSTRTARTEAMGESPASESRPAFDDMGDVGGDHGVDDPTPLPIPELPVTTPTKHVPTESVSSSDTTVMGKVPSPAISDLERVSSAQSAVPFNSYHSSQQGCSMYDSEGEEQLNGDDWDSHATNFSRQISRTDTHSVMDTNAGHHGHVDADSAHSSDDIRPVSKVSEPGPSNNGHVDTSEPREHKKSSSISRLMGRAMFTAVKPRISAASNDTPPLSPREGAVHSRRQSDASNSQSQHSMHSQYSHRGVSPAPDHSYGKLVSPNGSGLKSPVYNKEEADHANSLLIQHQLASGASSPVSFLPRATANDPRIHNSKLSPFPGIAALESRSRRPSEDHPRLIQQTSDPTLPLLRGMSPHGDAGRISNDSGAKQRVVNSSNHASISSHGGGSVFGTHSSASHSNGHSYASSHKRGLSHSQSDDHRHGQNDFAGNLRDPMRNGDLNLTDILRPGVKQRPEIPSFMTNRRRAPPPPIELTESNVVSINDDPVTPPSSKFSQLPPRSRDVLCRMDGVLSLPVNSPSRPDFLDDPPRKLLRSQQVLQVVNMNTVKDRYLFLFNDLLVIAKPIMGSGTTTANLDMKFVVKSIVGLDKLVVSGLDDEPTTDPARHPAVQQFIHDFAEDAVSAVRKLVERNNPLHDMATLANLLFTTVDLDKTQLGLLLASDPELLSAYLKMFDFNLVRIDEALRLFLLDVRLPTEIHAAEAVLRGFADGYITANESSVTFDMGLAEDLVLSTLELNDMLYSTFGFAFPNHAISRDTFIAAFESKDPLGLVPIELLRDIYTSIRGSKLIQGLSTHESHHVREVFQTPSQLPSKLTYHEWSDRFQLSIPKPDPHFQIKLAATGLELDPPVLDFSQTKDVSFRVRGTKLGWQTMLFERFGANAALYPTLGNSRSFLVERAFMRSTFCVAFPHHLGGKRKYCFSVPEASLRTKWGAALSRQTWLASTKKQQQTSGPVSKTAEGRTHRAAEAVALQVLRDALLPNEDKGEEVNRSPRSNAASSILARVLRHGSISAAYPKQAPDEADLPLLPTRGHSSATPGLVELRTGKELVLLCRQNSLLPAVLELLQKGAGTEKPAGDNVAKGPPQQQQQQKPANLPPSPPTQNPPRAAHLQAAQQPKKSAGLRAMMHDRRL